MFAQNILTVDNRPESGAQYTTVQDAVDAANANDIIYIHPSPDRYNNITINKTLTIIGSGHNLANFDGLRSSTANIILKDNCPNTKIIGLDAYGINASLNSNTDNLHLINNRFSGSVNLIENTNTSSKNWIIEGNYFDTSSSSYNMSMSGDIVNLIIQNNVIKGRIGNPNHTTIITNNTFIYNDTSGEAFIFTGVQSIASPVVTNNMFIFPNSSVTELVSSGNTPIVYNNCLTWKTSGSAIPALNGNNNLDNTNPMFTAIPNSVNDFYNNDYSLAPGSPAIAAGTDGGDLGIFGRDFPFDINGRPHSMPYPQLMNILNTLVSPGQNLNVEFKAAQKN